MNPEASRAMVELLARLIEARTVSYAPDRHPEGPPDGMPAPGEERRAVAILKTFLESAGVRCRLGGRAARPDLVAAVGRGQPGYRRLMLACPTDTPPAGARPWRLAPDPFRLWHRGNLLVGRGVALAKGPLAAAALALQRLAELRPRLAGRLFLVAHAAGVEGGAPGLQHLVRRRALGADEALVIGSGHGLERIVVAEKGQVLLRIQVSGLEAPGGALQFGRSAIHAAAALIQEVHGRPPWAPNDPLFPDGVTVNFPAVHGGGEPHLVAGACRLLADLRFPPVLHAHRVTDEFGRVLKRIIRDHGVEAEISVLIQAEPHRVPLDHPLIRAVRRVADAEPVGSGTRSAASLLGGLGMTAVGFGPGGREGFYAPDESVTLSELEAFSDLLVELARQTCSERLDEV